MEVLSESGVWHPWLCSKNQAIHDIPTLVLWLWNIWLRSISAEVGTLQLEQLKCIWLLSGPLQIFKWQGTLGNAPKFQDSWAKPYALLVGQTQFSAFLSPSRRWKRQDLKTVSHDLFRGNFKAINYRLTPKCMVN